MTINRNFIISLAVMLLIPLTSSAQRLMQKTGRAVVAVNRTGGRSVTSQGGQGSLISWRKLAEEPEGTTYNVYKRAKGSSSYTKINASPLSVTCLSTTLTNNTEYAVSAITPDGVEGEISKPFLYTTRSWPNVWFNFDFDNTVLHRDDYRTKYVWPMDLDGDGEFDAVVADRLYAGSSDSEEGGENTSTTSHKIQAYRLDGTLLWTVDMGPNVNICSGQNDMVLAYDINCDGRCEVIIRSSDGTRFWDKQNNTWGKYVGGSTTADIDNDGIVDYRTQTKRNPPFYISVIDGETGTELAYNELKYTELTEPNGDAYRRDNRADYMSFGYGAMEGHYGIAYLDGIHPSLVMECENRDNSGQHHGYILSWDYDWNDGTATNWHHSSTWVRNPKRPGCAEFHQIRILDSDGDGCDEMWAGGYGVNPLQDRFVSTGLAHGDRFIISDIDPDRPGLEGFAIQQSALLGQCLYDARTAERIKEWYLPSVYDVGRGACLDIDASHKGYEILSYADEFVYDCKGEKTGQTRTGSMFEGIWWDGRLQREWINSPGGSGWDTNIMITRVLGDRLVEFSQESSWATHGGTGTRPAFMGDLVGDWREEIILAKQNGSSSTGLTGYTTNIPTSYSIYCLQQDPHYRGDCTTRGYYQHPNTGYYLGGGMPMPPLPPVFTADERNTMVSGKSVMFDIQGDNAQPVAVNGESPTVIYLMNPRGHDYSFEGTGTTGNGQLIKSLQGTATWSCDLGHTGLNLISEGTLCVNGNISGPVELRARGTLAGNATLLDTITFEGALNYEGCRLKPGNDNHPEGVIVSKKSMTLPGEVYLEITAGFIGNSLETIPVSSYISVEGDLTFKGTNYVTVNLLNGDAATYKLAECTGTLTCDLSKLKVRGLGGINYDLAVEGKQLLLIINGSRKPADNVVWTGAESNVWDFKAKNFSLLSSATPFVSGDSVVFNAQGANKTITINESLPVGGVSFDAGKYVLSGDGGISGNGGITVNAMADVTLNMKYSDYTGATIVNGGKLTVPNFYDGGQKSAIGASTASEGNLVLNGGTLVLSKDNQATNHIITITDTATINISSSNSSLSLKGQVKGSGYLVKDGPGQLNFTYGGANNFAGVIVKKGVIAQGAWNSTFGRSGSPMVLAGGEVHQIDNNSTSTIPVFNHVTTIVEGTTNTINGSRRSKINGSFLGKGSLTILTHYVRCDIGADFSKFEGKLTLQNSDSDNDAVRLMQNVTDMSKTSLTIGAGSYVAHFASGGGSEVAATTKIGSLSSTATDAVLGGSSSIFKVGYLGADTEFVGLLKAQRVEKVGEGRLTLKTSGHTSPMTVSEGTLEMRSGDTAPMTSGTITVGNGGTLLGTGMLSSVTVQKGGIVRGGLASVTTGQLRIKNNLTLSSGSTVLVELGKTTGNTRLAVTGSITHNGDTILVHVPSGRELSEGEELQVFTSGYSSATGEVVVKCLSDDGKQYGFDTSLLNSDGKLVVNNQYVGVDNMMFSDDAMVDVFTTDGRKVRSGVRRTNALNALPAGVYVVGRMVNGRIVGCKEIK